MRTEDGQIIYKCLNGDSAAFGFLVDKYRESIYAFAYDRLGNFHDAEDVAQEALAKVVDEFKEISIEKSFSAWAVKVLDNRILAYIKKKKTTQSRITNTPPEEYPVIEGNSYSDLRVQLIKCLRKLYSVNNIYARIINLHYQGFTVADVCKRLKITTGHAYVILSRARAKLAECLDENSEVK